MALPEAFTRPLSLDDRPVRLDFQKPSLVLPHWAGQVDWTFETLSLESLTRFGTLSLESLTPPTPFFRPLRSDSTDCATDLHT